MKLLPLEHIIYLPILLDDHSHTVIRPIQLPKVCHGSLTSSMMWDSQLFRNDKGLSMASTIVLPLHCIVITRRCFAHLWPCVLEDYVKNVHCYAIFDDIALLLFTCVNTILHFC